MMPYPFRKYERKSFDAGACTQCGDCLAECPVLHLPPERARQEVPALVQCLANGAQPGPSTSRILAACTSCMACNLICPEDCRPANLILDIWRRQYEQEGLPVRARYFLPHSTPNFRTYVLDRLQPEEQRAVESWKSLEPAEEIFYPGCNIITTPCLTFSKLFEGLTIRGGLEYCCGEMYFRMGLYEHVEQVARKLTRYFQDLQVKRVHMLCTAGLNLFTNILPQFGAGFSGITFTSYLETLHARLASGEIPITRPFKGKTIAIQDSCHAKVYEEDYAQWPRRILALLGFTIIEPAHTQESALCCGIGSGFSHAAAYRKMDMIRGQRACMANVCRPGADYIAAYCSGCLEMMAVARYVYWPPRPTYHIIELIQEAMGETPPRRQGALARNFLKGTLLHQARGKGRFFVPPIK